MIKDTKTRKKSHESILQLTCLVDIVLLVEGLREGRLRSRLVLAQIGLAVSLGTRLELILSSLHVFILAIPDLEARRLHSARERECHRPGADTILRVHRIEKEGSILRQAAGKESYARNLARNTSLKHVDGSLSNPL